MLELHLDGLVLHIDGVFRGTLDVNLDHFKGEGAVGVLLKVQQGHGQGSVLCGCRQEMFLSDANA